MTENINERIQEKQASHLMGDEEENIGVVTLIQDSFASYKQKPADLPLTDWVEGEFRKHPDVFTSDQDIQQSAQ